MNSILESYKKISSKKYFYLIASLPWVLFILYLAQYLMRRGLAAFEYNDDFYMSMIAGGSFGEPSPYTVFNNILLGWVMAFLTKLAPAHNWFLLIQLGVIFFSYIVLGVWNICKNKLAIGYLTSLVFVLATVDSLVGRVSFTKSGGFAIAVGLLLLTTSLISQDWKSGTNRLVRILGILMIFGGGLFRRDSTLAALPFAVLLLLFILLRTKKELLLRACSFCSVFLLLLVVWIGHHLIYNSAEDWKYFTSYNNIRAELLDYYIPDYDDYTLELQELGISRVDYLTFTSYNFADRDVFSIDFIDKIISFRDSVQEKISLTDKISDTFDKLVDRSKQYLFFYIVLLFFFAVLSISNRKNFPFLLLSALFGVGELWILLFRGRLLEHVFYLTLIYSFITIMAFCEVEAEHKYATLKSVILFALIGVFTYYSCGYAELMSRTPASLPDSSQADAIFAYTSAHSDNLYVMEVNDNHLLLSSSYNSFYHFSDLKHKNIALSGGWMVPAPVVTDCIAPFGDKYNLFKLMATNEKVFWIVNKNYYVERFLEYLRIHYNPNASANIVDQIGNYYVLSLSTQ